MTTGANLIRQRMDALGLGQRALARESGVQQSALSRLLSGTNRELAPDTARRLAPVLGVSAAALLGVPEDLPDGLVALRHGDIAPSPLNPRRTFDPDTLRALAGSVRDRGLLQNLVVRPRPDGAGWWLVAGERRWRAIGLLVEDGDWPADHPIPCRVQHIDDAEHRALAIIENLQRDQVPAIEEAEAFQALIDLGWTTAKIAEAVHATQRHVQLRLALITKAAPEVQQALRNDEITLAQARAMTAAPAEAQTKALQRIKAGKGKRERAEDVHAALMAELQISRTAAAPSAQPRPARQGSDAERAFRAQVAIDDDTALRLTLYGVMAEHSHGTLLVVGGLRPTPQPFARLGHDLGDLAAPSPTRAGSIVWRRDRLAEAWRLIESLPIAEVHRIWSGIVADSLIFAAGDPARAALSKLYGLEDRR